MAGNDPVPSRKWMVGLVIVACLIAAYLFMKG